MKYEVNEIRENNYIIRVHKPIFESEEAKRKVRKEIEAALIEFEKERLRNERAYC